jgi:hypothetical protein
VRSFPDLKKPQSFLFLQVSTWLDKTAAAARKSKSDSATKASTSDTPVKTPMSAKKQMSIMAFVKKKKDEALATRILTGMVASPGNDDSSAEHYRCGGAIPHDKILHAANPALVVAPGRQG